MGVRAFRRTVCLWVLLLAWLWHAEAAAQPAPAATDAEIERESENPLTRYYTLPLRTKSAFGDGFYDATTSNVEISNALVPIPLDDAADVAQIRELRQRGSSGPNLRLGGPTDARLPFCAIARG
jgi:hypothetical protein